MKKLTAKKGVECMACLECVRACSTAFYKEFDPAKACLQIVDRKGAAKPMLCRSMSQRRHHAERERRLHRQQEALHRLRQVCRGMSLRRDGQGRDE